MNISVRFLFFCNLFFANCLATKEDTQYLPSQIINIDLYKTEIDNAENNFLEKIKKFENEEKLNEDLKKKENSEIYKEFIPYRDLLKVLFNTKLKECLAYENYKTKEEALKENLKNQIRPILEIFAERKVIYKESEEEKKMPENLKIMILSEDFS